MFRWFNIFRSDGNYIFVFFVAKIVIALQKDIRKVWENKSAGLAKITEIFCYIELPSHLEIGGIL